MKGRITKIQGLSETGDLYVNLIYCEEENNLSIGSGTISQGNFKFPIVITTVRDDYINLTMWLKNAEKLKLGDCICQN